MREGVVMVGNMLHRFGRVGIGISAGAVGAALMLASPAHAAPGDWVNVSAIAPTSGYPEISTSAVPAVAIFGSDVQIAWTRSDSSQAQGIYTAILNKGGSLTKASTPVVTGWSVLNGYPQLVGYQGQRAISFGGYPALGSSNGQNLSTSPNGVSWSTNTGSLSATNMAWSSSGGGTVNSTGDTLIWAGSPNLGPIVWHVGLAPTNPAPAGSDQSYQPPSTGTMGTSVTFSPSTGATYAAYYAKSGTASAAGTFVGQIHPAFSGFAQVPGSYALDSSGNAQSTEAGNIVPLTSRAQGGVYVAYLDVAADSSIKVREIASGAVLNVPGSSNADEVALSASANGRLWVAFEKGGQIFTSHTDPGAKAFGTPAAWGNAERGASIYGASVAGDNGGAYVAINAYAGGEQNMFATSVLPNLTVQVVGQPRKGATVKVRVLDGGAPVRNARVTVGGKTLKTKAGGITSFKAPRSGSVKVVAKGPGYRDGAATISLR